MSISLFAVSIARCDVKDAFTKFTGYTGVLGSVVAIAVTSYIVGGALCLGNGRQYSVLLITANDCGSAGGNRGCTQTIDNTEEWEGGDFVALFVWVF